MRTTPFRTLAPIALLAFALSACAEKEPTHPMAAPDVNQAAAPTAQAPNPTEENTPVATAVVVPARPSEPAVGETPPVAAADTAVLTTLRVYVEPSIATRCGVETNHAWFDFDSAAIREGAESRLDAIAACLQKGALAGQQVALVGHTDPRGTAEYNEELARERATSVQDYLHDKGVKTGRIEIIAKGEEGAPSAEDAWPMARRVDIRLEQAQPDEQTQD